MQSQYKIQSRAPVKGTLLLKKSSVVLGREQKNPLTTYDLEYNSKGNFTHKIKPTISSLPPHTKHLINPNSTLDTLTIKETSYPRRKFDGYLDFLKAQPNLWKVNHEVCGAATLKFGSDPDTNTFDSNVKPDYYTTNADSFVPMRYRQNFRKWIDTNRVPMVSDGAQKHTYNKNIRLEPLVTENMYRYQWPSKDYSNIYRFGKKPSNKRKEKFIRFQQ